jgi:hypothetical protein
MRVADVVVRAGGDHQLAVVLAVVAEGLVWFMKEEGEAAFKTAANVGTRPLPCAPFGEDTNLREVVPISELLQKKVGERRGRLDRDRGWRPLDEHHGAPDAAQRSAAKGARNPRPQSRHLHQRA